MRRTTTLECGEQQPSVGLPRSLSRVKGAAKSLALTFPFLATRPSCSPPEDPKETKDHCVDLYVKCVQEQWRGPCGDCLNKCTAQEEWDFDLCYRHPR
jgi:hypothetical protein